MFILFKGYNSDVLFRLYITRFIDNLLLTLKRHKIYILERKYMSRDDVHKCLGALGGDVSLDNLLF